jgi:hypothetical protein
MRCGLFLPPHRARRRRCGLRARWELRGASRSGWPPAALSQSSAETSSVTFLVRQCARWRLRQRRRAIGTIAADPKHIGRTRRRPVRPAHLGLRAHPHMIVPGGGIALDGTRWGKPAEILPPRPCAPSWKTKIQSDLLQVSDIDRFLPSAVHTVRRQRSPPMWTIFEGLVSHVLPATPRTSCIGNRHDRVGCVRLRGEGVQPSR